MNIRIESAELSNVNALITSLKNDQTDTTNLNSAISSLITEIETGENLYGSSYTLVKNKLISYQNILTKRKNSASELASAIESAIQQMSNYMAGYNILDTAEIGELNASLSAVNTTIRQIESKSWLKRTKDERHNLNEARTLADEIEKELEKLKNLGSADNSAFSKIASAQAMVSEYGTAVNSSQSSNITAL